MKVFFAVMAALSLFLTMCQIDAAARRTYSYCFIATMAILGAMEIIPLFLS